MKKKLSVTSPESVHVQSKNNTTINFNQRFRVLTPSVGAAIFETVTNFKAYQEAKRIGVYLSMPSGEVQTDAIVRHAIAAGKQVFVPYIHKSLNSTPDTPRSVMDMVDLRSLADYEALERDSWGIPTISSDTVEQRDHILQTSSQESRALDLILMPGVAFDMDSKTDHIRRLGHGKGFYDYFLQRYKQAWEAQADGKPNPETAVFLCGLALQEQFLTIDTGTSVPVGDHDHPLHSLVVGDGQLLESRRK